MLFASIRLLIILTACLVSSTGFAVDTPDIKFTTYGSIYYGPVIDDQKSVVGHYKYRAGPNNGSLIGVRAESEVLDDLTAVVDE